MRVDFGEAGRAPEQLRRIFATFARRECHGRTALYERLAEGIAQDDTLIALATHIRRGQPAPNLLLAAVHYLLLGGVAHPLPAWYPDLSAGPPEGDPFPHFRAFCLEHADALLPLLKTRIVQTAQARRCAGLLPAFAVVSREGGGLPLALVEIGASAGLNLLWDRYCYTYSDGQTCGDLTASVQLTTDLRGDLAPPVPAAFPAVAWRVGLDLNPIDVRDAAQTRWLEALIWPDEAGRAELLRQAIAAAQTDPPRLIRGDALETLPAALAEAPPDSTLCVFHSATVNQFGAEGRRRLAELLAEAGRSRPIRVIAMEALSGGEPELRLTRYDAAGSVERLLARCDAHGAWLEWLAADE